MKVEVLQGFALDPLSLYDLRNTDAHPVNLGKSVIRPASSWILTGFITPEPWQERQPFPRCNRAAATRLSLLW